MKGRICCLLMLGAFLLIALIPAAEGDGGWFVRTPPRIMEPVYVPSHERTIQLDGSGYPWVEYHYVTVNINGRYASTLVDQSFYNPYDMDLNGTYWFPVPDGAVITDFTLIIDGIAYHPEVVDAGEGREMMVNASERHQDASLLEFVDRRLFTFDVMIPSHQSRRIQLEYQEVVQRHRGMYRYTYTLGTEQFSSADIPRVSVRISINGRMELGEIICPTHDVNITRFGRRTAWIEYSVDNARPDTDILILYAGVEAPTEEIFRAWSGDKGFFSFLLPMPGENETEFRPRDVVFLVDVSESLGPWRDLTLETVHALIAELSRFDRYTIVAFSHRLSVLGQRFQYSTEHYNGQASRFLYTLPNYGYTDIPLGVGEAARLLRRQRYPDSDKMIVLLSDGLVEDYYLPKEITETISAHEIEVTLSTISLGKDANHHLMERIADAGGGRFVRVSGNRHVSAATTTVLHRWDGQNITGINIGFDGVKVWDIFPKRHSNVEAGSEMIIYGRYKHEWPKNTENIDGIHYSNYSEERVLTIHLNYSIGLQRVHLRFDHVVSLIEWDQNIDTFWASEKVDHILDRIEKRGEKRALVEQVTELGKTYELLTPYTSLFIDGPSFRNATVTRSNSDNIFPGDSDNTLSSILLLPFNGYAKKASYFNNMFIEVELIGIPYLFTWADQKYLVPEGIETEPEEGRPLKRKVKKEIVPPVVAPVVETSVPGDPTSLDDPVGTERLTRGLISREAWPRIMEVMFKPFRSYSLIAKGPPGPTLEEPQDEGGPFICIFGPMEPTDERIAAEAPRDPTELHERFLSSWLWNRDFRLSIWGSR